MTVAEWLLLLGAGIAAGMINSVSSGGSFFTYPAMLLAGLTPIQAATSTLAALTPGNLAAIPEYWPEVQQHRRKYPAVLVAVFIGSSMGIAALLLTGAEAFDVLVPWLILAATLSFAISPRVRQWAELHARSLTDGSVGVALLVLLSIYLTYFGSGVGHLFLAVFTVRGFGGFLGANVAKNVVMSLGTIMATLVYTFAGHIQWGPVVPVMIGSALGGVFGGRVARSVPLRWLRTFVIGFGLFVAGWQFIR